MKKLSLYLLLAAATLLTGCKNDDTDYSAYINGDSSVSTIYINYDGSSVTINGDSQGIVTANGAHVTVVTQRADSLTLVLSGSTTDGSLLVYRTRKFAIRLDGVSITNPTGPAINNQCKKALYVECADGTTNTLTDGTTYTTQLYDQKATLFSEGQIYFRGSGTLNVNAYGANAIASDDFIVVGDDVTINTVTATTGANGVKVNDGMYIGGGKLNISVASAGGRGIKCDSLTVVSGGITTIRTTGDCKVETIDGVKDTTSAACIKSLYPFTMTAGTLTMTSTGDGGKGLNCSADITVSGGTLSAITTGSNDLSKPKAVKSNTAITVSGGSFYAQVDKSWACDNGYEDSTLDNDQLALKRITIEGSPTTATIQKKLVIVKY